MAFPRGVETAADLMVRTGVRAVLPVVPALTGIFPRGGPEPGRIHGVSGDAAVSLVLAMVAAATEQGAWCVFVDMPHVGLGAAREHGVALHRVVFLDTGGSSSWARIVGALVDGFDIVVVAGPACRPAEARTVAARAKARGTVVVIHGDPGPFPLDLSLCTRTESWRFAAHATSRTVGITAGGRRAAGRRSVTVLLPSGNGRAGVP